ncbi:hypothetical protein [Thioclava sp.]|uniref:hypothetical protein n=1 Tax=Thioclava sp. TaxID=1933450 RepID=UPI003AA999AD
MRVIVHAGFHKTGSSTIQAILREARDRLPDWVFGLRYDIAGISRAARHVSINGDPLELGLFKAALADWLGEQRRDASGIVISNERIMGAMPGDPNVTSYAIAPILLGAMRDVIQKQLGKSVDLKFYLATRDPAAWIDSLHWQQVRTSSLTETQAAFRARIAPHFDIEKVLAETRAALGDTPLIVRALEDTRSLPEGPISPLLDLMGLSPTERAQIKPAQPHNARPRGVDLTTLADSLATINAQGLSSDAAEQAKREIMRVAWREDAKLRAEHE